jgi:hypothetical protein
MSKLHRGGRSTGCIDFATADWQRNEFGVDVLTLSRDAVSGAVTFALRTPAGLAYPEVEHFYDCEEDLFQFEGEFRHDDLVSYRTNDYVYRPIGTVYGNKVGSDGGIIIASLAREPMRFHFQGHPGPWTGHYLVDQRWNPRPVAPQVVRSDIERWTASGIDTALAWKLLRGTPGVRSVHSGASAHSPWAADAVFLIRIEAGFRGSFPAWPHTILECLVLEGSAECAGVSWQRGCYAFDGLRGSCRVDQTLTVYVRAFVDPQ